MATTHVHRNVAQLLLDEGIFSETTLVDHLGECIERYKDDAKRARLKRTHDDKKDQEMLNGVVTTINVQLEPLGLKVARMKSRISGDWERYYGIVNLNEDDFSKQDWLSKSEQEFFHKLVEEILESETKQIDAVDAANMGRTLSATSKLSASDAGKCLERLERGQWLSKSDDGNYSLGVRTELQRRYLTEDSARPEASSQPQTLD